MEETVDSRRNFCHVTTIEWSAPSPLPRATGVTVERSAGKKADRCTSCERCECACEQWNVMGTAGQSALGRSTLARPRPPSWRGRRGGEGRVTERRLQHVTAVIPLIPPGAGDDDTAVCGQVVWRSIDDMDHKLGSLSQSLDLEQATPGVTVRARGVAKAAFTMLDSWAVGPGWNVADLASTALCTCCTNLMLRHALSLYLMT
ncbi:hypothetical protein J6590_035291 [Homalodisca vitripennis]|nr:hypothetical protein J6590_035291 [Homalodisca vitripennis]